MKNKRKHIRKLEARLAQTLSLQRRGLEQIEKILASADRPQGQGIWGISPDMFWVGRPPTGEGLLIYRAYVLLDGRVCRVPLPHEEVLDWELVTKEALKALVDPRTLERILFATADRESIRLSDKMPAITFPPGTFEKLENLRDLLETPP